MRVMYLFLLLLLIAFSAQLTAEIKYDVKGVERLCATHDTLFIDVEIQSTGSTAFQLGTSSFVFNYNSTALHAPANAGQRKVAANDGPWKANNDDDYAAVATSAPSAGIISLIIDISGSGSDMAGVEVPSTWTRAGTLRLLVDNTASTSTLTWRNISVNTVIQCFANPGVDYSMTNITANAGTQFVTPLDVLLPVELTSFTASVSRLNAQLKWSTATEKNNYGFEIERRSVEIANAPWAKVGFVQGAGTSASPKNYSYIDASAASGRYSYRLKQIDNNGAFTYSQSTEVELGLVAKVLTLGDSYPNPFNPSTTIEFTLAKDGRAVLKVYNAVGQEVAELFNGEALAGRIIQTHFDASRLASGIYFSRLQVDGNSLVKRMMLIK